MSRYSDEQNRVQKNTLIAQAKPLTPQELADFYKVSINTVYYWVSRPGFPSFKAGRHLRFYLDKVQRYFDELPASESRPCQIPRFSLNPKRSNCSLKTKDAGRGDPHKKEASHGNK